VSCADVPPSIPSSIALTPGMPSQHTQRTLVLLAKSVSGLSFGGARYSLNDDVLFQLLLISCTLPFALSSCPRRRGARHIRLSMHSSRLYVRSSVEMFASRLTQTCLSSHVASQRGLGLHHHYHHSRGVDPAHQPEARRPGHRDPSSKSASVSPP
jgi:hypothetical protein